MLFSSEPASHHEVLAQFVTAYDRMIASGEYQPFVYPSATVGASVVILYLLVDHRSRPWLRYCRFLVWGYMSYFALWCVFNTRARNPAASFGVGLISAWSILWTGVMLVFNDAQTDFRRIERKERYWSAKPIEKEASNSSGTQVSAVGSTEGLRRRNTSEVQQEVPDGEVGSTQSPSQRTGTLAWQPYPTSPFIERLDWVADVFSNFRGMGWNWRIGGLPSPPLSVQRELHQNSGTPISSADTHVSRTGYHRFHTASALLRENLYVFLRNYILIDILKTLIVHDPYFWNGSRSRPPHYLPLNFQASPVFVQSFRLLISLAAIGIALQTIFALGPLFFVGLLGPNILGARGESWMYPDSFGSFANVLDKGLAGWWGGWWHQSFRYAFEAPASRAIQALGWEKKAPKAKVLQLVFAFGLSGCLHACGSVTQLGETRPLAGPMRFFSLQILGIGAQLALATGLQKSGVLEWCPKWVRRTGNFVYVHVWFYYTAPLLCDDFAKGGIWLFEPLPVSLLRGVGLGAKGDGFWMWYGGIAWWHKGDSWWNTGIAL